MSWLRKTFNPLTKSPPDQNHSYQIKSLEEKTQKLQETLSSLQNTIGIIVKFSTTQIGKQARAEEINNGILKVLTQHEEEIESFKTLLNQHADVINTLRKHVYKDILIEEKKKDLDENSETNTFLNIKKKINKDN